MKIKIAFGIIIILLSLASFGQFKTARIVPLPKNHLNPVIIFDGIKLPSSFMKEFFSENEEIIDSVSIQSDSIFDCNGELTNLGIVKIYTKDFINPGAKKILTLTDDWLYKHPLTNLMINNIDLEWDAEVYRKFISLQPDDIVYAKVRKGKKSNCNETLKIKIKE